MNVIQATSPIGVARARVSHRSKDTRLDASGFMAVAKRSQSDIRVPCTPVPDVTASSGKARDRYRRKSSHRLGQATNTSHDEFRPARLVRGCGLADVLGKQLRQPRLRVLMRRIKRLRYWL